MPWKPLKTPACRGLSKRDRELIDRVPFRWGTDEPLRVIRYIDQVWYITEKNEANRQRAEHRQSKHWLDLRATAYKRAGGCCERCGVRGANRYGDRQHVLNLHHKTYERWGAELLEDVELICQGCHEAEHGTEFGSFRYSF